MPYDCKGFPEYYSEILKQWNTSFYEWKYDSINSLESGQICQAYISYENDKQYFLVQQSSNPYNEEETLWKLQEAQTRQPVRQERLQYFGLETNEFPIVKKSKLRDVVLLKPAGSNWLNPTNPESAASKWLVLPLFSYKPRHSVVFVQNDQKLLEADRFYFPPAIELNHRIHESSALFSFIQIIPTTAIFPLRAVCKEAGMQKGFKVSLLVLKFITYHFFSNLGIIDSLFRDGNTIRDEYELFKIFLTDLFDANDLKQEH